MQRGWEVIYKDGSTIKEIDSDWKDVKKKDIRSLILRFDNRSWIISDKNGYLQKKRGSIVPGFADSFSIEERSIGYYDGSSKVWYTVNEHTGVMQIKVEE